MGHVDVVGYSTMAGLGPAATPSIVNKAVIESAKCREDLRLDNNPRAPTSGGVGIVFDPFHFSWDCPSDDDECEFKTGNTIRITSGTIAFIDITKVSYSLAKCSGSFWRVGFSLGLGLFTMRWVVR